MTRGRFVACVALGWGMVVVWTPTAARAAAWKVVPGQSIQAAVDAAAPGDTVKVMPGDYVETHDADVAVRITKPLKLIAKSKKDAKVRLLRNPDKPNQRHGILAQGADDAWIERVKIRGFTVEGFPKNGIWLQYVDNFRIESNESVNNLENGIFPTLSANGLVKKNVAYGSLDSGLWVEASENVRVIKNEFYNNPTGLEITVSKNVVATKNDVHDNTVGIGLYHPNGASLPPLGNDGDWDISGNHVHDNNFPNPVSGGLVGSLPAGVGVLLIGVDRVTVQKNLIEDNDLVGVSVVDWCLFNDCENDPPVVEDKADDNIIDSNTIAANGTDPNPGTDDPILNAVLAGFASEVLYLSEGTNNCFSNNLIGGPKGTVPSPLPSC